MSDTERTPAERFDAVELAVLHLLVEPSEQSIWSPDEIGREVGDSIDADDALGSLRRAGLIHRTVDGFIFATRQAIRYT